MCNVAAIAVSGKTKWEVLDTLIKRLFKEYLSRVDPTTSLGLGTESIASYHVGEVVRYKDSPTPELLPCGYLVGNADTISICLKGAIHNGSVDALAFETLIPKSIIQRFVSLSFSLEYFSVIPFQKCMFDFKIHFQQVYIVTH